jgi:hypothetical protein
MNPEAQPTNPEIPEDFELVKRMLAKAKRAHRRLEEDAEDTLCYGLQEREGKFSKIKELADLFSQAERLLSEVRKRFADLTKTSGSVDPEMRKAEAILAGDKSSILAKAKEIYGEIEQIESCPGIMDGLLEKAKAEDAQITSEKRHEKEKSDLLKKMRESENLLQQAEGAMITFLREHDARWDEVSPAEDRPSLKEDRQKNSLALQRQNAKMELNGVQDQLSKLLPINKKHLREQEARLARDLGRLTDEHKAASDRHKMFRTELESLQKALEEKGSAFYADFARAEGLDDDYLRKRYSYLQIFTSERSGPAIKADLNVLTKWAWTRHMGGVY